VSHLNAQEGNALIQGTLGGLLGLEFLTVEHGKVVSRLEVRPDLMAPNGYLHAATVVALADTSCGFGCLASLPEGVAGFTTVELKTNLTGTAREGEVRCESVLVHGGRSTQVWEARVTANGKTIALFVCTQMLLRSRS
jgi:1,4-dihydroxy-2-naphthoyl-CoA hydrolase